MTLDEGKTSIISNADFESELEGVMYGKDNRPAWVGRYRPFTEVERLKPAAHWATVHYGFYLNFVRDCMTHKGVVLDIGSGAGQNAAMLTRYSEMVFGLEPDARAFEFSVTYNLVPQHLKFILGAFPTKDMTPKFDYIFIIETIEHIEHAKQFDFLGAALATLKEDGLLFITTPNESTSSAPHVGIWSPGWMQKIQEHFPSNIQRNGFFSNKEPDAGFSDDNKRSHRAVVMHR